MYIKIIVFVALSTICMMTSIYGQEHKEGYSIQMKYSSTIEIVNFSEICAVVSSVYSEFDCSSERNPTYVEENKDEYLEISIRRKKKIKMVLNTTNPSSDNIEKFHKLEERLDRY